MKARIGIMRDSVTEKPSKIPVYEDMRGSDTDVNSVVNGFKKLWGVGGYLLLIVLLVEGMTMVVQPWVSYPLRMTRDVQIGLTVILGGLWVAGMIWFNVSLNLITVNLLAGERTLVTHGPFSYVRHPLYATIVLTALPLTIVWSADGLFVIAWLIILLLSHALVLQEERGLQEEFGDAYTTYRQYVPALLPYKGHGGKRYRTRHAQEHPLR
jgi:protein-S-isoprenylcysteine O-methyltransferase Ste14